MSTAALDALVCGYAPSRKAQKILVMQAFSDDSMSGEGSKTLLLAACVQKYSVWADFCFEWEATLALSPSIEYFKMREARQLIKQFAGWNPAARDEKIKALADVIQGYRPRIVYAWVSRTEFNDIVRPIIPYMLRHPYIPLFYALIIHLAEWQLESGITLPADFVFDEQGAVGAEAVHWYSFIKSIQKPEIAALMGSTPVFRDDKFILPLQAADMAAWHMRRRKDNPDEDLTVGPTSPLETLSYAEVHLQEKYLTVVASELAKIPGVEIAHDKPVGYKAPTLPAR